MLLGRSGTVIAVELWDLLTAQAVFGGLSKTELWTQKAHISRKDPRCVLKHADFTKGMKTVSQRAIMQVRFIGI